VRNRRTSVVANIVLLVISVFIACIVGELALRIFRPVKFRSPPEEVVPGGPGDLGELIHIKSDIPGLRYELLPNAVKEYGGILFKTCSHGIRDKEFNLTKPAGTYRIAAIGDSVTFGLGVPGEYTYPNVLENMLNRSESGSTRRYEVLNCGVSGYSTRDEALYLKHRIMKWDPDLITIGYVWNDPETDPMHPLQWYFQDPEWWQNFHLLRLYKKFRYMLDINKLGDGNYIRYLYNHRVKWGSVITALGEIDRVTETAGIDVILIVFPRVREDSWREYPFGYIHDRITKSGEEHQFTVIDLYNLFSGYSAPDLMVAPGDGHPGVEGHNLAAGEIFRVIQAMSQTRN